MRIITFLPVLLITLFFGACNETKQVIDVAGNIQLSGSYTITSIASKSIEGSTLSLSFDPIDKLVRGQTGCNSFFGNYTLEFYNLSFGEMGVSERYCDEAAMEIESNYLNALRSTGSYALRNNVLTLFSGIDKSVLLQATKEVKDLN